MTKLLQMTSGEASQSPEAFMSMFGRYDAVSVEVQRQILSDVQRRHQLAWADTDIVLKIIERMHIAEGQRRLSLWRPMQYDFLGGMIERHEIEVGYVVQQDGVEYTPTRSLVPISTAAEGRRRVVAPFTPDEAGLIAGQVQELQQLKDQGVLPQLSRTLNTIVTPTTPLPTAA